MAHQIWHVRGRNAPAFAAVRRLDMRLYDSTSDDEDALGDGLGAFRGMVYASLLSLCVGTVIRVAWMTFVN